MQQLARLQPPYSSSVACGLNLDCQSQSSLNTPSGVAFLFLTQQRRAPMLGGRPSGSGSIAGVSSSSPMQVAGAATLGGHMMRHVWGAYAEHLATLDSCETFRMNGRQALLAIRHDTSVRARNQSVFNNIGAGVALCRTGRYLAVANLDWFDLQSIMHSCACQLTESAINMTQTQFFNSKQADWGKL